jgi:protein-tyrosine phosphatase
MFSVYRKRKKKSANMTPQQYIILHEFAKQKVMGR